MAGDDVGGGRASAASEPEERVLRTAYRDERARTLRHRLVIGTAFYLAFAAIALLLEHEHHAERATVRAWVLVVEFLVCLCGVGLIWQPWVRRFTAAIASGATSLLLVLLLGYNAAVGGAAERCAMFQASILNAVAVLMPWGGRAQLFVSATSIVGFGVVARHLPGTDASTYAVVALLVVGLTSVCGALFLDRYRYDAFARTALLTHASAIKEEEAEIAAVLQRVAETLGAHLGEPDLIERVNAIATEALGTHWGCAWVWDERRAAFRLGAHVGVNAETVSEIAPLELALDDLPLLRALRPGELIEFTDAEDQPYMPLALIRRWRMGSTLYAPVARRGEIIAILGFGHWAENTPFTTKQRRLALGIAHTTAVALENARLIADLHAASRLKSEFVASMSHELRTPLNVITGYSDLLAEGAFGSLAVDQRDTVARIRRSAIELHELVNATLDLGRLEAGREAVEVAPIDLRELFAELDRELELLVPPAVRLGCGIEPGAELLESDRVKVKTILKNLISNALKFTPAGEVAVRARRVGEHVVLSVHDTGVGIAPDDLPVIFDMFRQVDGSATRRFGGVGLGLHIVKRLVTLLGGLITVESKPSVGSAFSVTLPHRRRSEDRATGT